jgi:hypothetical protein
MTASASKPSGATRGAAEQADRDSSGRPFRSGETCHNFIPASAQSARWAHP